MNNHYFFKKQNFPFFAQHPTWTYLDHNATSIRPLCVLNASNDYYCNYAMNLHNKTGFFSMKLAKIVHQTRASLVQLIKGNVAEEIVFTANTTMGLNMLSYALKDQLKAKDEILIHPLSHASNLLPWMQVAEQQDAIIKQIPLLKDYHIDYDSLGDMITAKTKIIAVSNVDNVLGVKNDMQRLVQTVKALNPHLWVICDGAQGIGAYQQEVVKWKVDFYVASLHKIMGPSGLGFVWADQATWAKIKPPFVGGGTSIKVDQSCHKVVYSQLPELFEPGTQPLNLIAQTLPVLEHWLTWDYAAYHTYISHLKQKLLFALMKNFKADVLTIYNASHKNNVVLLRVNNVPGEDVAAFLAEEHKMIVRAGDMCVKLIPYYMESNNFVRVSFGPYNNEQDVDKLIRALKDCVQKLGPLTQAVEGISCPSKQSYRSSKQEKMLAVYNHLFHNKLQPNLAHAITCEISQNNCLDNFNLQIQIDEDNQMIQDLYYQGTGCIISCVALSVLAKTLKNKPLLQAKMIISEYQRMLKKQAGTLNPILEELVLFSDIYQHPNRYKCAWMGAETILKVIDEKTQVLS